MTLSIVSLIYVRMTVAINHANRDLCVLCVYAANKGRKFSCRDILSIASLLAVLQRVANNPLNFRSIQMFSVQKLN